MNSITAIRLVESGARQLDRLGPPDWRERVNVDQIDMADWSNCVAAQIYGGWGNAWDGIRFHEAFAGDLARWDDNNAPTFEALRLAWVAYLTGEVAA